MSEKGLKERITDFFSRELERTKECLSKSARRTFVAVLLLEGILAGATLPQSLDEGRVVLADLNRDAYELTTGSVYFWYNELVRHTYVALADPISADDLQAALFHKKTRENLDHLCELQEEKKHTEIHGIVTLDMNEGIPTLHFYEQPTYNGEVAQYLVKNKDDTKKLEQYVFDHLNLFSDVTGLEKEEIINKVEQGNVSLVCEIYNIHSSVAAYGKKEDLTKLFHQNLFGIDGVVVGFFHVHPYGDKPSKTDIESSMRHGLFELVIAPKNGSYNIYVVNNGAVETLLQE